MSNISIVGDTAQLLEEMGIICTFEQQPIERIRPNYIDDCKRYTEEAAAWWAINEGARIDENPAFVHFITDYCGKSKFFPGWLKHASSSAADAMCPALGLGWSQPDDNFGTIDPTDEHAPWARSYPILLFIRIRGKITVALIKQQRNLMDANEIQSILELSAGNLIPYTALNFKLDRNFQHLTACDQDSRITLESIRSACPNFADKLDGVEYLHGDNEKVIDTLQRSFNFISMGGGYIYYPPEARRCLVGKALKLLKKGGTLVYDHQVEHWAMDFARQVLGWSAGHPIFLAENMTALQEDVQWYIDNHGVNAIIYPIRDNEGLLVGASIKLVKT